MSPIVSVHPVQKCVTLFRTRSKMPTELRARNHTPFNSKQKAYQLVGLGETPRHSNLQSRQTYSQIHCVITGDLLSNRHRIMRHCAGCTSFTLFAAVLVNFCSRGKQTLWWTDDDGEQRHWRTQVITYGQKAMLAFCLTRSSP